MDRIKTAGIVAALMGLAVIMQKRRQDNHLKKALEANWKDIRKKLPDDWADIVPKKRKEADRLIDAVHRATGESRRRIRRTLHGLTA